jgi:hypothetical protein
MKTINLDDLTVGENRAMNLAGDIWARLYALKPGYLTSLIAKLDKLEDEETILGLPILKLVLFFAEYLQEHVKNDPKLGEAMDKARARAEMMEMTGL